MPTFPTATATSKKNTIKGGIKNFNGCASLSHKRQIIKEVLKCNQLRMTL